MRNMDWAVLALMSCVLAGGITGSALAQEVEVVEGKGLGSCENARLSGWASSKRVETTNDVLQSWVGAGLSKIVANWGAPYSTFDNRDGSRIVTWKDSEWDGQCTKTFKVDTQDVLTHWNYHGCRCRNGERPNLIPKTTPVPQMTL